ncbi:o-succinylbenzoate--CoA ligase [Litchfieldia alkalitelluris]|uniref:o-succinylbenzoate--CoA ligase n=1 Tax=Litchfieldia alkalitelluris TaxID=304268 RepID=UPI000998CE38|nr:o-succinylbenzoate--CoA ligase [Litchfieldia alkalitelluris]
MNVTPNWLANRAFLTPNRFAVRTEEIVLTFKELHERVLTTSQQLSYLGVKHGDTISVLMTNSVEMIQIIHALKYIGVKTVLLNARLTNYELLWQLRDSKSDCIITEEKFIPLLDCDGIDSKILQVENIGASPLKEVKIVQEFSLEEIDTIMYTSGTTGKPKGVIQTYGNHWWSATGSVLNLGLREDDCWLAVVPFFHISGLSILMRSVIYGIPVIIHERFSPEKANHAIKYEGVTIVSVVSTMLSQMLTVLGDEKYSPSFRCMLLGGGPAPESLLHDCKAKEIPVYQTYGMTETASQIVTLAPEYSLSKLGSAGKPLFPSQLRIEKDGLIQRSYEHGEIVVKGPNVTKGYIYKENETKDSIKDGWFYTGDIGYIDDEGFLYVLDRRSDLIISGGENIYPAEIESVLLSHPKIIEAGVIGIRDEQWGQVPIAFVKTDDKQLSETVIKDFCSQKVSRYKIPREIYFLDELPRNATNKLLRRKLLEYLPS